MRTFIALVRLLSGVLEAAFREWWEDNAPRLAAAVAFYTVISLAPLVIIAIAIASAIFGQAAVQGEVVAKFAAFTGDQAASVIQAILANARTSHSGPFATAVSIIILLSAATAVFVELQHALNRVWEVRAPGTLKGAVIQRLISFLIVLGIGLLLAAALIIEAAARIAVAYLGHTVPGLAQLFFLLDIILPFAVITALFAMFYKVLPDVKIGWTDVAAGSLITALLFVLGNYLLGFYLRRSAVTSAYGAAGSLVVFLLWIYYSVQIFLFGAEITHVYATRRGVRVTPIRGAVPAHSGIAKDGPGRETGPLPCDGTTHTETINGE
jgi:membrane protein